METNRKPRTGQLSIAVVSKITKFGAYCKLIEYGDKEAFLPIREISSGWIKNIREHIHEGQKVVCYINNIDENKGTIDVSIKRVTTKESKDKIREYNLEKRLSAVFLQAIRAAKEDNRKVQLVESTESLFGTYRNFALQLNENPKAIADAQIPPAVIEEFKRIIEASRKEKHFIVAYNAKIVTYNTLLGATELREAFKKVAKLGLSVIYLGAPRYKIIAEGTDYADAEKKIKETEDIIKNIIKDGEISFEKEKIKKEKENIMESI